MKNVVEKVLFNNEPPTQYDYKYFQVVMKKGKIHTFHYHINNPIPTKDEMMGSTWCEVIQLAKNKFYEAIKIGPQ